jgi:hypothetical protein
MMVDWHGWEAKGCILLVYVVYMLQTVKKTESRFSCRSASGVDSAILRDSEIWRFSHQVDELKSSHDSSPNRGQNRGL